MTKQLDPFWCYKDNESKLVIDGVMPKGWSDAPKEAKKSVEKKTTKAK